MARTSAHSDDIELIPGPIAIKIVSFMPIISVVIVSTRSLANPTLVPASPGPL